MPLHHNQLSCSEKFTAEGKTVYSFFHEQIKINLEMGECPSVWAFGLKMLFNGNKYARNATQMLKLI
jgi:hypothetical protein